MGIWFISILILIFLFLRPLLIKYFNDLTSLLSNRYTKLLFSWSAWSLAFTVLVSIIIFFFPHVWIDSVVNNVVPDALSTNIERLDSGSGARGDTFGGALSPFIGWFAAIITFAAFWVQYQANEQQKKVNKKDRRDTKIERFESRFFKFIDYHRDNVALLKYRDPKTKEEKYWEGNQVFTVIYYEIKDLLEEYMKNKPIPKESDIKIKAEAVNFIYQCIFWGSGKHSFPILKDEFGKIEFKYIHFRKRRAAYSINKKTVEVETFKYSIEKLHFYYTGHVRRLGHYFRNIYQAVKYVDEQDFLTEKQKYDYVTILRAQMSVYEQAVFFYNSLSDLGDVWEWKHYAQAYPKDIEGRRKIFKKLLITKYDLIRNVINKKGEISKGINIKDFYPLINLERENELEKVSSLPFIDNQKEICRFCFNKKYINYYKNEPEALEKAKDEIIEIYNASTVLEINCSEGAGCETRKIFN